jgi:HD-GYP domain-containing protein (c-di-GMP phosphodiesterase class II)
MKTLGVTVVEKNSASDAIALLDVLPNIDLVIIREKISNENSALNLANYLIKQQYSTPMIIMGKNKTTYVNVCSVDITLSWKSTIEEAARVLGMHPSWEESLVVQDFVSLPVTYFLNIHSISTGCDIYIRVKKLDGQFQYIKRLHSHDYFKRDDIEKYISTGLTEFFIKKESFPVFVNFVTEQLVRQLDQTSLIGTERLQLTAETYEVTLDRIHAIGIDDATVEIVQESIRSMETSLKEADALNNFLGMIKDHQMSYLYAHSYFTCLLLHSIVEKFPWSTKQIKDKITYLAYFHDISLTEDHLVSINNLQEFNLHTFKDGEELKVRTHALNSAQIVDRFAVVPRGVSQIIKEHHGTKSGIGFPVSLDDDINPLSMMFVTVEHFVDSFLKLQKEVTESQLKNIFNEMKKIYNKSTYAQTLSALETLTTGK